MRFARAALRVRPTTFKAPALRRGYAEAVADKIKLSLALPHQVCADLFWWHDGGGGGGRCGWIGGRGELLERLADEHMRT
ncbi:hypothetical protein DID88_007428 [Monilinia fructigena]|uniref:Uncharacterized protein n=1 Tax=Monilinia fructigena TaxID=38457 RepID=A0A395JDB8_9HELO|nr:hypothetical protein DID88_007428 [Monilinia fructigena]